MASSGIPRSATGVAHVRAPVDRDGAAIGTPVVSRPMAARVANPSKLP
jgi:hypothetical protein